MTVREWVVTLLRCSDLGLFSLAVFVNHTNTFPTRGSDPRHVARNCFGVATSTTGLSVHLKSQFNIIYDVEFGVLKVLREVSTTLTKQIINIFIF